MDDFDRRIAGLLQGDNGLSNAEIGRAIGLSVSATNERVRRLNSSGAIRGNRAVLDPERMGAALCAFVFIDLAPHPDEAGFRAEIARRPEVQELHQVAGTHCYLAKVRTSDMRALQGFLTDHVKSQSDVLRTESIIVLETVKETSELAIAVQGDGGCASTDG